MKFSKILQRLFLGGVFISNLLLAETNLALMYAGANPDYKPFNSPYGFSVSGQFDFDNGLFLSGYFSDTNFTGSGPDVGMVQVENWLETGIGYSFTHDWGQFYSLITLERVDSQSKTYNGYGAHFGYRNDFAENWTGVIQFGYFNTGFDDWQLIGKLNYDISENFGVTFVLRDYDRWDYTNYEAGIVFRF